MPNQRTKVVRLGTLTIPAGQAASPSLAADLYGRFDSISIAAPAVLTNASIKVRAAQDDPPTQWGDVQSPPGTDVVLAAGKTIVLTAFPFPHFRLEGAGTEAADRVFVVYGQYQTVAGA